MGEGGRVTEQEEECKGRTPREGKRRQEKNIEERKEKGEGDRVKGMEGGRMQENYGKGKERQGKNMQEWKDKIYKEGEGVTGMEGEIMEVKDRLERGGRQRKQCS